MSRITRAFSRDILSSNMAASTATEINIHLCKHLFTLLCRMVSPFVVQAHDDACVWLPWISRSVCTIRWPCWRTAWRQWKHSIYCFVYMPRGILPRTYSENWRKRIIRADCSCFSPRSKPDRTCTLICIKNNHNLSKKIDEDEFFFFNFQNMAHCINVYKKTLVN